MNRYSALVDQLTIRGDLLKKLHPTEPMDVKTILQIRQASDEDVAGKNPVQNQAMFTLVRAGLFYLYDAIDESHALIKDLSDDTSAYWHGMIHRREVDFENARYWFRRTGTHPTFSEMQSQASRHSAVMATQMNWDPYLFVGLCEQYKFGAVENHQELIQLQRVEFDVIFDYVWRKSFVPA